MLPNIKSPEKLCQILIDKFINEEIKPEEVISVDGTTKGKIKNNEIGGCDISDNNKPEILMIDFTKHIKIEDISLVDYKMYKISIFEKFNYLIVLENIIDNIEKEISKFDYTDIIVIKKDNLKLELKYLYGKEYKNSYIDIAASFLFYEKSSKKEKIDMYFYVNNNKIKFNFLGDVCFTLKGFNK